MLSREFAGRFTDNVIMMKERLILDLEGFSIGLSSNSLPLLERLASYFSFVVAETDHQADCEIICVESAVIETGLDFIDWKREPGKQSRKEMFFDLEDGRLIQKVRTGMLFLQSQAVLLAIGPCRCNDNQVINFINNQYMNFLQQQGALICHASAAELNNAAIAFAGFSGGGKSTLMLHMLANEGVSFVSNDRLFLSRDSGHVKATGIPKLPRVNPGTLVHDTLLRNILSENSIELLLNMPKSELWNLEQKYDVDIDDIYGIGKISNSNQLKIFVILNWHFNNTDDCVISKVNVRQKPDLLRAVMKSSGPFYQDAKGKFLHEPLLHNHAAYLDYLDDIDVYEINGRVDFQMAADYFMGLMSSL